MSEYRDAFCSEACIAMHSALRHAACLDAFCARGQVDEGVVWAHRGHIIFHNRDRANDFVRMAAAGKSPSEAQTLRIIKQAEVGNVFLKKQAFVAAFEVCLLQAGVSCLWLCDRWRSMCLIDGGQCAIRCCLSDLLRGRLPHCRG